MASPSENADDAQPPGLPTPELLNGIIPGFEVTAFLAQGGMGAIYRGEQTKLERPVAIKILPHSYGEEFNYTERFEIEAKAMAKLSHNNIVSVYDYGETTDGAFLFFVMEYIEGSNLYQILQKGPLEVDQAVNVLRQVCSGLQYAHEHGIIHRDIKPSNILVNQRGTVKMADFGLAKVARERGTPASGADDEGDMVMGTPDYIAPEALIEGVEIDYRADIFSVGVLTYEVLTGKLPRGSFTAPSHARPGVDRRFDDIVRMAMLEDRGARYQEVSEIDRVLAEIAKAPKLLTGKGKKNRKSRPPRPLAGKAHLPVAKVHKPKALPIQKTPAVPAQKIPASPVQKTPVLPVQKTPAATPVQKSPAAPKRKVAIPQTKTASPAVRRATVRHRRPTPPKKTPASAMMAIGLAFLVIILIGVAMMWYKSRSEKPEENPDNSVPAPAGAPTGSPASPPAGNPKKKDDDDGSFFGVPLE